jgi:hypothetical protein
MPNEGVVGNLYRLVLLQRKQINVRLKPKMPSIRSAFKKWLG